MIIYRGPSMLDGSPIVVIATGFDGSRNEKTGKEIIQTYILRDDMHPVEASRSGADVSICGGCRKRGQYDESGRIAGTRECYVNLGTGVNTAWDAFQRGIYPTASRDELPGFFSDRIIRVGTYGDGAAAPAWVWHTILNAGKGRTGYTHQWRDPRFQYLKAYCMASVDSEAEAIEAHAMGWRTFRVAEAVGWRKLPLEGLCPASFEAGKRTTCDDCQLCSGTEGHGKGSIMIPRHDTSANAEKRRAGILPPIKRNPSVKVRKVSKAA